MFLLITSLQYIGSMFSSSQTICFHSVPDKRSILACMTKENKVCLVQGSWFNYHHYRIFFIFG